MAEKLAALNLPAAGDAEEEQATTAMVPPSPDSVHILLRKALRADDRAAQAGAAGRGERGLDLLFIPGGESTTMAKLANYHNLAAVSIYSKHLGSTLVGFGKEGDHLDHDRWGGYRARGLSPVMPCHYSRSLLAHGFKEKEQEAELLLCIAVKEILWQTDGGKWVCCVTVWPDWKSKRKKLVGCYHGKFYMCLTGLKSKESSVIFYFIFTSRRHLFSHVVSYAESIIFNLPGKWMVISATASFVMVLIVCMTVGLPTRCSFEKTLLHPRIYIGRWNRY